MPKFFDDEFLLEVHRFMADRAQKEKLAEEETEKNRLLVEAWIRDIVRPAFEELSQYMRSNGREVVVAPVPRKPKPQLPSMTQAEADRRNHFDFSQVKITVKRGGEPEFIYALKVSGAPVEPRIRKGISVSLPENTKHSKIRSEYSGDSGRLPSGQDILNDFWADYTAMVAKMPLVREEE